MNTDMRSRKSSMKSGKESKPNIKSKSKFKNDDGFETFGASKQLTSVHMKLLAKNQKSSSKKSLTKKKAEHSALYNNPSLRAQSFKV